MKTAREFAKEVAGWNFDVDDATALIEQRDAEIRAEERENVEENAEWLDYIHVDLCRMIQLMNQGRNFESIQILKALLSRPEWKASLSEVKEQSLNEPGNGA